MSSARRKSIALRSVVTRRSSGSFSYDAETASVRPADIRQLVRVYLIDGSSKVLQMEERSTVEDVLLQLKFNMDLESVSTYALYSVEKNTATMIPLPLKIRDVLANMEIGAGLDDVIADRPRILFRSWIYDKSGKFERSVYQDDASEKTPSSSLWLKFIEEVHMTAHGKYLLTREESILLGVLRMQGESGDYAPKVHTTTAIAERVAARFPDPIGGEMTQLLHRRLAAAVIEAEACASRIILLYSRIAGMTKPEAQIEFLRTLRTWCPFYGALMFEVDCQYDYAPTDSGTIPPVIHLTAAVGSKGIYLISNTKSNERTIMLHSYSKILKYKAYSDQNIFIYWVLKRTVDPSLVYEAAMQDGEAFNPDIYCDKVYIVADSCSEIEFLVQSYVAIETDCKRPLLPGVSERYLRAEGLLKEKELDYPTVSVVTESEPLNITDTSMRKELVAEAVEDAFFQGSLAKSIEKEGYHSDSHLYGDDAVGVETSVFRDLYASLAHSAAAVANGTRERTSIEDNMQAPPTVKLAVTMEDLQHKQASGIYNFSDNEEATEELEVQSEDDAAGSSSCRYSLSESSDEAVATVMPPGIADKLADTSLPASGRFSRLFKWG